MHYALHINNKIMIILMRIYQWTFQKEALLVYCFQVELQFGVLLFVKVGRQENCKQHTSFLCHMQFSKEWLLSFEFVHVVINEETSTEMYAIIFHYNFSAQNPPLKIHKEMTISKHHKRQMNSKFKQLILSY